MSDKPLVTVTVCARNGARWVDDCLNAIHAQTHRPLEIIAVNDGSTDSTGSLMDAWMESNSDSDVSISILHQDALGLSAGRMAALNHAQGEWGAITDIDVRPEQDWIEQLLLSNVPVGEETIVAVTGRTIFQTHTDLVSRFRAVEIASKYRSRPRRTSLANGPCSMFKRQALLDAGGFDPSWYHAEDMEVIKRYFPNAVSSMKEATLNLMTPEKTTSPMFSHIQYNQFEGNYPQDPHPDKEGEGKEFGVHQIQYYNNKPPRFNPKVTELSFTSQQPHYKMGVILVMTDEYLKDLKQLKITKSVS